MVQIGQPHDKRKYRPAKAGDYYDFKAALEKPEVTKWPHCELCGIELRGKTYAGSKTGKFIGQECWNETVTG